MCYHLCDSGLAATRVVLSSGIKRSCTMTTFTIEMPDTLTVAMRNGASVNVSTADISALGAELLAYGIGQKLRDAASAASGVAKEAGEDVQAVAQGMLDAAYKALTSGEWSHRGEG